MPMMLWSIPTALAQGNLDQLDVAGLAEGAFVLMERFHTPVVFEGAPWSPVQVDAARSKDNTVKRAVNGVRCDYPASATIEVAAQALVDAWNQRTDVPHYRVASVRGVVHLRATTRVLEDGSSVPWEPPTQAVVELPSDTGTPTELYRAVVAELRAGGLEVQDGYAGFEVDDGRSERITLGRRRAPAAELLDEVFAATPTVDAWTLWWVGPPHHAGGWTIGFERDRPDYEWRLNRAPRTEGER